MWENRLFHEDCVGERGMCQIPNQSVSLIFTDLPYGTTQNRWDTVIPYDVLWKEYERVIKPNGAIVLFAQNLFASDLIQSNRKLFKYKWIWVKDRPSNFLNAKRMPLFDFEELLVFYKKAPTYNPQFFEGKPLHGMGSKYKEGQLKNNNYGEFKSHENPSANRTGDTKKYPRTTLFYPKPHPPIHPTQKPIDLAEYIIRTYTDESDVVLDSCTGVGTIPIASVRTGRKFVAFEKEQGFYEKAYERIAESITEEKRDFYQNFFSTP
ncbi:cytosine methyltransferase [Bacillus sp. M6-12]|uniref:DNA-methyltransferase n=1 Tax=Bacillus sp. M6-12 TaxID=2054166 RepID=UPI000C7699E0|nr:DNA methyltransferase [Bacillus sp. M6-12]PLS19698.1 cytosine methyltransferase [Bacillus sp. M6-12]